MTTLTEKQRPVAPNDRPARSLSSTFRYRVESFALGEKPHTLVLTFNVPGEEGRRHVFDFTPYLDKGVFRELQDPAYFGSVRLDRQFGKVEWPNGQDLDPATLYAYSQPLP